MIDGLKSSEQVTKGIWRIEEEMDLFNTKIQGVYIWERIRYQIQQEILLKLGLIGKKSAIIKNKFLKKIIFTIQSIVLVIKEIQLFFKQKDIVFIGKMSRKKQEDGLYWDILFDPVINKIKNEDYLLLQPDHGFKYFNPAKTENVLHLGFVFVVSQIRKKFFLKRDSFSRSEILFMRKMQDKFEKEFDINLEISKLISDILFTRKAESEVYKFLFKKLSPKVVILQVGNNKSDIIEVLKEMQIPTIELQHGAIGKYDVAYSYPKKGITKRTFCNYFFVFGDYWKDFIRYPIKRKNVISVGNPYLDCQKVKYLYTKKKNQILFLSQGPIGKELSKFASELSNSKDLDFNIIYKLHPDEYENWRERFPFLAEASDQERIFVVDKDFPPIYKLMAESKIQIGVYSTAIYEGLCFGLETFLFEASGIESMSYLLDYGYARKVKTAKDVINGINERRNRITVDQKYFFRPNAIHNILENIEKIKN